MGWTCRAGLGWLPLRTPAGVSLTFSGDVLFFRGFLSLFFCASISYPDPPDPACLPALRGEHVVASLARAFNIGWGHLPPLVLEPLLSASAQSPCIPLVAAPMPCLDVQAARDRSARPSQLSPFRQRASKVSETCLLPEVDRVMRQSRAERCISVDCQVTPLSSSFCPLI